MDEQAVPPTNVGSNDRLGLLPAPDFSVDHGITGCYYADTVLRLLAEQREQLCAERSFDSLGMVLIHGKSRAPALPGEPHRWADVISAWARGDLVQWRYASPEATDADWRDCNYCSTGEPNWWHAALEYRVWPNVL